MANKNNDAEDRNELVIHLPKSLLWTLSIAVIGGLASVAVSSAWFVVALDKRMTATEKAAISHRTFTENHLDAPWHGEAGRRFAAMTVTLKNLESNGETQAEDIKAIRELLTRILLERNNHRTGAVK